MRRRRVRDLDAGDRRRLVAVVVVCALAALLDTWREHGSGAPLPSVVTATVFAVIWTGLQILGTWLATAAEVTVTVLAHVVGWLATRVAHLIVSSGAIFAKVWEGLRVVWRDVLRPALRWIDTHVRTLYKWLHDTFKPLFDFLDDVRKRFTDFYTKFVRPVLDTIDFIRAINRVLVALHIHVLEGLDRVLALVEQRIDRAFSFVMQQLTRVQDWLDRITTGNGIFQKWILVASLSRYAPTWIRNFWSHQIGPVRGHDGSPERTAKYPRRRADVERDALAAYFDVGAGDKRGIIEELAVQLMQTADSLAPTTDDTMAVDELVNA